MSNYYILTNLLSDDERRVITSIVRHIELGGNKVGIQQIASENYVSTAFIMKLCKRLGFAGYSELYYNLAQSSGEGHRSSDPDPLCGLIDGYTPEQAEQFCKMLMQYKERKIFVVGEGFAEEVANYIVKRLAICGFMVFNHVHFYDYMLFREEANRQITSNVESSLIIAISQSGETEAIINDVRGGEQGLFRHLLHAPLGFQAGANVGPDVPRRRLQPDAHQRRAESVFRQGHPRVRGADGAAFPIRRCICFI